MCAVDGTVANWIKHQQPAARLIWHEKALARFSK